MMPVKNDSILAMKGVRLHSLSHQVDLGTHCYYLVQLSCKKTNAIIYTWEEASGLKKRFSVESKQQDKYIAQGKRLQTQTKWPASRHQAMIQIRNKFWDQEKSDCEVDCKRQTNCVQSAQKSTTVSQQKNKTSENNQYHRLAEENYLKQNTGQSKNNIKEKEKIMKELAKNKSTDQLSLTTKSDTLSKGQSEFYKILQIKVRSLTKGSQIYFRVRDILGEELEISSNILRKTHLNQIIEYFERALKVNL